MVAHERSIGILRPFEMTRSRLRFPVLSTVHGYGSQKYSRRHKDPNSAILNLFDIPWKERFINPTDHHDDLYSWWHLL